MIYDHGIEYPTPPGTDGYLYDPATGAVQPRTPESIPVRWGVVAVLLALTLLVGAVAYPIATQAPLLHVADER